METTTATYDGEVLRPDKKLHLKPGERVRIIVEKKEEDPYGWLEELGEAKLEGPPDASVRVNDPSYVLRKEEEDDE